MGKMMQAGRLDRLVTINSVSIAQDANGAPITTYPALATVPCARWYLSGTETDAGDGSTQQVLTGVRFTIRFRDDVLTNMVLTCEGDDFTITGIEEGGRRDTLTLYAVTRAA